MPYRYLEEIATADIGFEAWAPTLEALIVDAADALMNVMVEDLETIAQKRSIPITAHDQNEDMLLFQALQELIYFKDAEQLLLRLSDVRIERRDSGLYLAANGCGEQIDPSRHDMSIDVKAVTMHRFAVTHTGAEWCATIVLDI